MKAPRFVWEYMRFVVREVKEDFPGDQDRAEIAEITARKAIMNYERGLVTMEEAIMSISCIRRAMKEVYR